MKIFTKISVYTVKQTWLVYLISMLFIHILLFQKSNPVKLFFLTFLASLFLTIFINKIMILIGSIAYIAGIINQQLDIISFLKIKSLFLKDFFITDKTLLFYLSLYAITAIVLYIVRKISFKFIKSD